MGFPRDLRGYSRITAGPLSYDQIWSAWGILQSRPPASQTGTLLLSYTLFLALNMAMDLFVFGDSFAVHSPHEPWTWVESVRSATGASLHAHAVSGSSLEWTYHCFEQARGKMSAGDIMIFCPTSLDRRWFFRDMPDCASVHGLVAPTAVEHLSADAIQAVRGYYRYLDGTGMQRIHLLNWLEMVGHLAISRDMRCLVIPAFPDARSVVEEGKDRYPNIHVADGDLFEVCYNESVGPGKMTMVNDNRRNHICRDNHGILAAKVVSWIREGRPIDTRGFLRGIVTPEIAAREGWGTMMLS